MSYSAPQNPRYEPPGRLPPWRPPPVPPQRPTPTGGRPEPPAERGYREGLAAHADYHSGDGPAHLDRAVSAFQAAVTDAKAGEPQRATYSNSLGVALLDRYRLRQETGDLHSALDHFLEAYERGKLDTFERARALRNVHTALVLLTALPYQYRSGRKRHRLDSLEAVRRELARTPGVPVLERVKNSYESGRTAADAHGPAAGYEDLSTAVLLLPLAVWGSREQKLDMLAEVPGLASAAAASALAEGKPVRALELLEYGRAVLWEQDLKSYLPREELRASLPKKAPPVVQQMDRVHAGLSRLDSTTPTHAGDPRMDADRWGRRWREEALSAAMADPSPAELHRQWETHAQEAQRLLPHRTFRQPDFLQDIRPAADEGPLVIVNVSPWRCDALIVTSDLEQPTVVRLPHLKAAEAEAQAQRYLDAMTRTGSGREKVVTDVLDWLWHTVARPVLAALKGLTVASGVRMWWIPTGPLTTLPLHAAALHRAEPALPRPVSSYTPTVQALQHARLLHRLARRGILDFRRRHLLVTPTVGELPGAARTRAHLDRLLPRGRRTVLTGPKATRARVSAALPRHVWTHFDCHAVQNLNEPLNSHLALHDGPLTVSDLADLPTARAEFAFLAACTTGTGGNQVRDEWVSLTAALMYAEFPTVIGTIWPVPDGPTARIAQGVYDRLIPRRRWRFRLPLTSPQLRAHALHAALLDERKRHPDHPSAWVSFVHYGV